ncbi:hypothetical protein, partial [uncultured Bradyrhizobium sp.]|uniref:hypothetical protein n=1 Tax=uncultured Bradyrhizobium sp. TaxID=199684 RepID=UPI00261C7B3B
LPNGFKKRIDINPQLKGRLKPLGALSTCDDVGDFAHDMRQKSDARIRTAANSREFPLRSCIAATLFVSSRMNRNVACVHRLYFTSHRLKIIFRK